MSRFSVISFVWGPGQRTPIHDHRTWGLVGILRGGEISTTYQCLPGGGLEVGETERLDPGRVVAVSPSIVAVHLCAPTPMTTACRSVNAGIPNKVAALRNGTIGWTLAGFLLEKGRVERFSALSETGREVARARARRWADKGGVEMLDFATLDRWQEERGARTLYRFDVRKPEEFAGGHPKGFESAPGGQLVQATDEWVAVRGARIVLYDDDGVRALMTASWLVQMGWDAAVIEEGILATDERGRSAARCRRGVAVAGGSGKTGRRIRRCLASPAYRKGRAPGAWFVVGARLRQDLRAVPGGGPVILTSADGPLALDDLEDARAATSRPVHVLAGGLQAWVADGFALETAPCSWASEPNEYNEMILRATSCNHTALKYMRDMVSDDVFGTTNIRLIT